MIWSLENQKSVFRKCECRLTQKAPAILDFVLRESLIVYGDQRVVVILISQYIITSRPEIPLKRLVIQR
jgi:hypothetical protein